MNCFWLAAVLVVFASGHRVKRTESNFVVMTFNIWQSGSNVERGLDKIAVHIKRNRPDIVALQEVSDAGVVDELLRRLGRDWSGQATRYSYPDSGILTHHSIIQDSVSQTSRGIGARIQLNGSNRVVHFWSFHLDYKSYGPYAAYNKLVTSYEQIMAGELGEGTGRFANMREVLLNDNFQAAVSKAEEEPLIVCGDFNAPSHLDWTNETKSIHGDWEFDWPATKMLQGETGLIDSYREIHPNASSDPGVTWSTVEKMSSTGWGWTIPEPQDRIDYIFYKGHLLQAVDSFTYEGTEFVSPKPYHWKNDYPSDHYAVITKFIIS